jgi:hypothetical protein
MLMINLNAERMRGTFTNPTGPPVFGALQVIVRTGGLKNAERR